VLLSGFPTVAATLEEHGPDISARVRSVMDAMRRQLHDATEQAPSHGDFRNAHVFVAADCTTVIDFDGLAMREPARDVGFAVGHLLTASWFDRGSLSLGIKEGTTFLKTYLLKSETAVPRIRLHIAHAIFQRALYPAAKHRDTGALKMWLELVEQFLFGSTTMPLLDV
jgi:aminoglycoside phosphotransferase (APT) family kinase protein